MVRFIFCLVVQCSKCILCLVSILALCLQADWAPTTLYFEEITGQVSGHISYNFLAPLSTCTHPWSPARNVPINESRHTYNCELRTPHRAPIMCHAALLMRLRYPPMAPPMSPMHHRVRPRLRPFNHQPMTWKILRRPREWQQPRILWTRTQPFHFLEDQSGSILIIR